MPMPTPEDRASGKAPLGFLVFLALITSVVALTIDAILPAMDAISADLGFARVQDQQLIVLVVFLGLGLGQPVFGPIADAIGRRKTALIGWVLYCAGAVIAMTAPGLWGILLGRFLQGLGAAGPRVVATAIVRDLYEGRAMARMVSMIMTIFMAVPMIAPLIGQGLEALGSWRTIFWLYIVIAVGTCAWHLTRIPETLAPENRRPLSFKPTIAAFAEVLSTRATMCYTLAAGAIFSSFAAMLASAQQIFEDLFALGPLFPIVFAAMAGVFALGQFTSSRLVMSMGMRRLCRIGAGMVVGAGLIASLISGLAYGGMPPLWLFMVACTPVFIGAAWLFSNLNALALEPMGHIAGTASAVVMSISTLVSVPMGTLIARQVDTTVLPILVGFTIFGALSFILIEAAEQARKA
ncbi:MAG: multidrug effflux MFS transporter [Pseudomonadota bacterium]